MASYGYGKHFAAAQRLREQDQIAKDWKRPVPTAATIFCGPIWWYHKNKQTKIAKAVRQTARAAATVSHIQN